MTGFAKDARVEIVAGYLRGVQGVISSVEGPMLRVSVSSLPPRMERSEIGGFVVVRAIDCKVMA